MEKKILQKDGRIALGVQMRGMQSRGKRKRAEKKQRLNLRRALADSTDVPSSPAAKSTEFKFSSLREALEEAGSSGPSAGERSNAMRRKRLRSGGSQRGLRKALADERQQMQSVLQHTAYQTDPVAALRAHLTATLSPLTPASVTAQQQSRQSKTRSATAQPQSRQSKTQRAKKKKNTSGKKMRGRH